MLLVTEHPLYKNMKSFFLIDLKGIYKYIEKVEYHGKTWSSAMVRARANEDSRINIAGPGNHGNHGNFVEKS